MFRKRTPEESLLEGHPQIAARYKRQAPGQAPVGITATPDNSDLTSAPANIPNSKATNSANVNTQILNGPTSVTSMNDDSMGTTSQDMDIRDTETTSQNPSGSNPNISYPNTQNISTNLNGSAPDNAQTQSVSNIITTSHHNNSIIYTTTTEDVNIVTTTLQSQSVVPAQQGTTAGPRFVPNQNTAHPGYVITTAGSVHSSPK